MDESADGRLVVEHEGGYSSAYVPFCGLAVVEQPLDGACPLDADFKKGNRQQRAAVADDLLQRVGFGGALPGQFLRHVRPAHGAQVSPGGVLQPHMIRVLHQRFADDRLHRAGARLGVYVHHDDAVREYAYDRKTQIGKLDKGLDEAPKRGWRVTSMKNDWKVIFPFER